MTDAPTPSPSASAPAAPASAAAAPAAAPAASAEAPAAATRPEFLPEQFWDDKAGAIKTDEFAKHYGEVTANAQKLSERMAAVPPNPEGYKVELKLPEGTKIPEGIKFDPAKDPRTPVLLKVAHELGWTNNDVNRLVTLDAEFALANHAAEQARIGEENKKLGDNANARVAAVTNWVKGLAEKGDLTADELTEIRMTATTAAGVTALEKLMAKATGGIPGHVPNTDPKPAPTTIEQRWYGSNSQQKAS
jgi:hypothetical protein